MPRILTVCASSTYDQLASKERLKDVLGVTSTDDDDLMDDILDRATEAVERHVGRILRRQTYLEKAPAHGDLYLEVSQRPVTSIASILKDTDTVSSTSYELTSPMSGLVYRALGWSWTAGLITELIDHVVPGSELNRYTVEYTAGYVPSSATSTELGVPRDIERAVLETSKAWYLGRKMNPNILEKDVDGLRIKYARSGGGTQGRVSEGALPAQVEALLSPYVSVI